MIITKNRNKKIRLPFLILALFLAIPAFSRAEEPKTPPKKAFGIAISPSVIRLTGKPGQSQEATVRVSNNGVSSARIAVEASDVGNVVDAKGKLSRQFFPAGTLPFSCAKWTLLRDNDFLLKPDEFKAVNFIVSPPKDSVGGSACVVFLRGIPTASNPDLKEETQAQATIQIQPRLGAMVFYEIEGTLRRTGKLLDLKYEPPSAGKPLKLLYVFENTGNADVLVSGTFYVLDANKTLVAKGDLEPIRTFPGDKGYGETAWETTLPSGTYQLVVTFELGPGTQEVIVKELQFSIP